MIKWPTPQVSDGEGGRKPVTEFTGTTFRSYNKKSNQHFGAKLRDAVEMDMPEDKVLNPDWVGMLMNLGPYAYTAVNVNISYLEKVNEIGCENCREILRLLWKEVAKEEVQREVGRVSNFPQTEILWCRVHGQSANPEKPIKIYGEEESFRQYFSELLRELRIKAQASKTSRELSRTIECEDSVSEMSYECACCRWILGWAEYDTGDKGLPCLWENQNAKEQGVTQGFLPSENVLKEMWVGVKKKFRYDCITKLDGVPYGKQRIDRIRMLGNGVVPATAALAFYLLGKQLMEEKDEGLRSMEDSESV